jgi:hypothetical protein
MKLPGFTAEASSYTSVRHLLAVSFDALAGRGAASVAPQQQDDGGDDCTTGPCVGGRQRTCCRLRECFPYEVCHPGFCEDKWVCRTRVRCGWGSCVRD